MNDLQELLLNKYVEILNKPEHQNLLRAISNKDNKYPISIWALSLSIMKAQNIKF